MDEEYRPTERDAVDCAIQLLRGNYTGNSDFDKGMRTLQSLLKKQTDIIKSLSTGEPAVVRLAPGPGFHDPDFDCDDYVHQETPENEIIGGRRCEGRNHWMACPTCRWRIK